MSTVYVIGGVRRGFCAYSWSFTGEEMRLGWEPSDGDKIRLSVIPRVPPYQEKNDDAFGDSRNTERHIRSAVILKYKAYLCGIISNHSDKDKSYWLSMQGKFLEMAKEEIDDVSRRVSKERRGTNNGRIVQKVP
jgi:hypothetical protein